jgi:hypothetical protein
MKTRWVLVPIFTAVHHAAWLIALLADYQLGWDTFDRGGNPTPTEQAAATIHSVLSFPVLTALQDRLFRPGGGVFRLAVLANSLVGGVCLYLVIQLWRGSMRPTIVDEE